MIFNRIKGFFNRINISGIYFGRSLNTVPKGGLVFFPYDPTILGCGIAGVLAFNRPSSKAKALAYVKDLDHKIETLRAHCLEDLQKAGGDLGEYFGGQALLQEMRAVGAKFKGRDVFYEVFSEKSCRDRLTALCAKLENIIEGEKSCSGESKGTFRCGRLRVGRVSGLSTGRSLVVLAPRGPREC